MPAGKPDAEVDIDAGLVGRLLAEQHPHLATLTLSPLDSGWDNVIFRLGDDYTVRIPRREIAAQLVVNEQTWLPTLAERLPIPVPTPIAIGEPTDYYPWHWSILPCFEGESADRTPPASSQADVFAEFLVALHQPAPENAPHNPVRGVPIRAREANTLERLDRVREKTDLITEEIERLWNAALTAPDASETRWLHGDLHAQNVLVGADRAFSAIIDWGDITAGDVATDLAGTWALFESASDRQRILNRYAPDDATLVRSRGWAAMFGIVLLDSGLINSPRHAAAGTRILMRLQEESPAS